MAFTKPNRYTQSMFVDVVTRIRIFVVVICISFSNISIVGTFNVRVIIPQVMTFRDCYTIWIVVCLLRAGPSLVIFIILVRLVRFCCIIIVLFVASIQRCTLCMIELSSVAIEEIDNLEITILVFENMSNARTQRMTNGTLFEQPN